MAQFTDTIWFLQLNQLIFHIYAKMFVQANIELLIQRKKSALGTTLKLVPFRGKTTDLETQANIDDALVWESKETQFKSFWSWSRMVRAVAIFF